MTEHPTPETTEIVYAAVRHMRQIGANIQEIGAFLDEVGFRDLEALTDLFREDEQETGEPLSPDEQAAFDRDDALRLHVTPWSCVVMTRRYLERVHGGPLPRNSTIASNLLRYGGACIVDLDDGPRRVFLNLSEDELEAVLYGEGLYVPWEAVTLKHWGEA
jgi:DNA-binding transcriptional MerR regulator